MEHSRDSSVSSSFCPLGVSATRNADVEPGSALFATRPRSVKQATSLVATPNVVRIVPANSNNELGPSRSALSPAQYSVSRKLLLPTSVILISIRGSQNLCAGCRSDIPGCTLAVLLLRALNLGRLASRRSTSRQLRRGRPTALPRL